MIRRRSPNRFALKLSFSDIDKRVLLVKLLVDFREENRPAVPADATILATHQEQMFLGIPEAESTKRIGFTVDHVDDSSLQTPLLGFNHRRLKLIQVMIGSLRWMGRCAVNRFTGLQMHLHGSQRDSGVSFDQQGRGQVIADIGFMRQLQQILLAVVAGIVQLAPIVRKQHEGRFTSAASVSPHRSERLNQGRQRDGFVIEEPPRGLCGGGRVAKFRQRFGPRCVSRRGLHMRLHQLYETLSQAFLQIDLNFKLGILR